MLVLTRKKGERVMIGDDIVVTLIDIRGDGVRIGFDAPRGVAIQRAEVVTAVTEANAEAAATSAASEEVLVGLLSRGARPAPESGVVAPEPQPTADAEPRPAPVPPAERRPIPKPGPRPRS
ncbi:MAG: carbon storage regulator CsrA [Amnibacterium sp.]